ncbi:MULTISPECIES: DeoR/GlpR family DNA-binding transcription regulator [unclassified Ensifer]|uniref:DeoR/GlpR family DNA-binding transcription regulator n=2 Tax=Ensifer TaxID=106591 RepID=UPI0007124356|nr:MULTISPECIES: DeoR/GlpR family DNA-binding transcription regulator [unclassified Ensifer]KQX53836.1 glycerol-3-phosphate transcriptional regulator protein [Ensifer sp. Root1298]KQX72998.1 glycerol-3-phosphate transcriptional regulator protein [Ensifer sp. Root1312]KRC24120.1 glycerol-3-phosphate transcriptional regulator protein [Ensifer sp. Root74]KRD72393.1 glycerol-3-phosphate transcriptional regulator protein [Ensifer sp. Root954]
MRVMDDRDISDGDKKTRRQAQLLSHLEKNHYISIEEITGLFGVTTQTARRDIMALEQEGKVRRLHGGATIATPVDPNIYRQRRIDNAEVKERIGQLTAELVADGAAVFLDTGTTCEAVARGLLKRRDLRVVTYSLRVATTLSESSSFAVAVPGGFVRQVDAGVFREETADYIRKFKFDVAIISVSGIDQDGDIGDDDHAEVAAVSAAMRQAERVILAVDSSKFGRRALVRLASLADIDALVTNELPEKRLVSLLREHGVSIHC